MKLTRSGVIKKSYDIEEYGSEKAVIDYKKMFASSIAKSCPISKFQIIDEVFKLPLDMIFANEKNTTDA